MTHDEIIALLKEADVLNEGHFVYTSGKHGDKYFQCARIFQTPKYSQAICTAVAKKFKDSGIELVIGPAMGAIHMAYEVSRVLGINNYFAERVDGKFQLRRGFEIQKGTRCLLVEDVVTTGGSVLEVKELVEQLGGKVAGIGVIIDRTGGKVDFGVPFDSAIKMDVQAYEPADCPLCKEGKIALTKPGSRGLK